MIDIHNHLLYDVDDGANSIEESIDVLKDLQKFGYTDIILTPHYIKDSRYSEERSNNLKKIRILREELKKNNISVNLYLGNEIFMDDDIYELLESDIISSLNGTNYLLIELPMSGEYPSYQEVFKHLLSKGYRIVLAHPERYLSFQEDYNKIIELEEIGIYFQGNLDSIIGKYGSQAEKMIKRLLKENKLSFLATDIHHKKHDYNNWDKAKKIALKYITEEVFDTLTRENPSLLID